MKNIITIIKKELKRFFTDRRILFGIFFPGILIYLLYTIMGNFMGDIISPKQEYIVYSNNTPTEFIDSHLFESNDEIIIHFNEDDSLTKEDIISKVESGDIHLYLDFPTNFIQEINNNETPIPKVTMYYNISNETSLSCSSYYSNILDAFEDSLNNKFDIEEISYGSSDDLFKSIFSMVIPMLLLTFLFSGAMGLCMDSIAGEKERGTIATLLVTPTKRSHIVIGKITALSIAALLSAIVSFFGLILSLPKLMGGVEFSFTFKEYLLILVITLTLVLLFVTILAIVSTYSKTTKEANALATPLTIVVMACGLLTFTSTSNLGFAFIPVYNAACCFKSIISGVVDSSFLLCTVLANLIYIGIGLFGLTKMFNSEKVMFNS